MASLGTLAVNIVARTEKFTAGITKTLTQVGLLSGGTDDANKKISKQAQLLGNLSGRLSGTTKLIGAYLAAQAGIGSISAIRGMVDDMGDLSDQAKSLGMTTESLTGIRHAAMLGGVNVNKLNVALTKMVVNVSKANATGKGSVFDALGELGINAATLSRLKPEQQLGAIADTLREVSSDADRARLAYTIFGKAGVSLIPMLEGGSGGLRRMAKDAESLGLVFSGEQVGKVEEFGDALDNLSASLGQLGQGLLIDVAPAAIETTNALMEAVRGIQGLRGKGGSREEERLEGWLPDATGSDYFETLNPLQGTIYNATLQNLESDDAGQLSAEQQAAAAKRTAASVAMGEVGNEKRADSLAIGQNQGEAIGNISNRFGKMLGAAFTTSNAQNLLDPIATGLATSFTAVSKKIEYDADLMKRAEQVSDSLMTPAESVAKQMKEIDTLVSGGAMGAARGAQLKKRLREDSATSAAPKRELTARMAGDIDTYAAARRNLGDSQKPQIDLLTRIAKAIEAQNKKKPKTPPVYSIAGMG